MLVERVGIQRLDVDILDSAWVPKQHARRICWVVPKTINTSAGGRYLVGRSARQHGPLERSAGHVGTCVRNYGTTRLTILQFLYIVVTQQCVSDMRLRVLWGMVTFWQEFIEVHRTNGVNEALKPKFIVTNSKRRLRSTLFPVENVGNCIRIVMKS